MEKLINVKEAAERLAISPHTVRAWVFQRRLPFIRLGRRIGLREADLQAFVDKHFVPSKD